MQTLYTHETICFHCGHVLFITPDAARCEHCNTDLHSLIPPDAASDYFYRRAASFSERGETKLALAEVQRGLDFHESSELRLLGALVARQIGDAPYMRRQLAAIPLDDPLRGEAEWLLQSYSASAHQSKTDAPKAAKGVDRVAVKVSSTEGSGSTLRAKPTRTRPTPTLQASAVVGASPIQALTFDATTRMRPILAALLCLSLVVLVWNVRRQMPVIVLSPVKAIPNVTPVPTASLEMLLPSPTPPSLNAPSQPQENTEAIVSVSVETETQVTDAIGSVGAASPASAPAPTEPIASIDPASALPASQPVDLAAILTAAGRADLASLSVQASVRDTTLLLSGVVQRMDERAALINVARTVPNMSEVDALNLLVRTPETYTVQPGDTLWAIAARFYGNDVQRVSAIFEANRDIMSNAGDLRVGMVLKLPPMQ